MRISTTQIYTDASRNMMENQSSLLDIQNKLSSGKEFTSLAEDPVGASQVVSLKRELAQLEMYQTNVESSRRRLELEENTLQDLNTTMDRLRELTIQAGSGTMTDADRSIIAYDMEQLVEFAAGLMNTRDAKGEYLFSGSKGTIETYTLSGGRYYYQGDSTTRDIQISSALYIESSDAGQFMFESITGEPQLKALGDMGQIITGQAITDIAEFASSMQDTGDLQIEVDGSDAIGYTYSIKDSAGNLVLDGNGFPLAQNVTYDPTVDTPVDTIPGISFTLDLPGESDTAWASPDVAASGLSATESAAIVADDPYTNLMRAAGGEVVIKSVEVTPGVYEYKAYASDGTTELLDADDDPLLTATPADPLYPTGPAVLTLADPTDASGATIAMNITRDAAASATSEEVSLLFEAGTSATLRFDQPPTNILNAALDTIDLLRTPASGNEMQTAALVAGLALALEQITTAQERISESTASVGSRLKTLDDVELTNTDFKLMTEGTLSAVQDLDYAAASTELSKRQLALEAAYASFAKIQGLSLFNYIN